MKEVDVTKWSRVAQYKWFASFDDPSVGFTSRMDITELLKYCRANGISSSAALMYIIGRSTQEVDAFRYRFVDGKVYDVENIRVGYTLAVDDCFINCYAYVTDSFQPFADALKANKENATLDGFDSYNAEDHPEDIYTTTIPWFDFTDMKHPIPQNDESNSVPRIAIGKYTEEGDRVKMALNITASHALVDGRNFGEIFNRIQSYMDHPADVLK